MQLPSSRRHHSSHPTQSLVSALAFCLDEKELLNRATNEKTATGAVFKGSE